MSVVLTNKGTAQVVAVIFRFPRRCLLPHIPNERLAAPRSHAHARHGRFGSRRFLDGEAFRPGLRRRACPMHLLCLPEAKEGLLVKATDAARQLLGDADELSRNCFIHMCYCLPAFCSGLIE